MSKRILPADVYDTLELSAFAYDGIGAYAASTGPVADAEGNGNPLCVHGHAAFVCDVAPSSAYASRGTPVGNALRAVGIYANTNDVALGDIIHRIEPSGASRRVTFAAWCKALEVERGA